MFTRWVFIYVSFNFSNVMHVRFSQHNPKQTNTVQSGHFQISYLHIEKAYYTRFKRPTWRLLVAIYIGNPYHDHCRKAEWAQQTASNKEAVDRNVSDHELESAASFVPAALTSVEVPFAPDPKGEYLDGRIT